MCHWKLLKQKKTILEIGTKYLEKKTKQQYHSENIGCLKLNYWSIKKVNILSYIFSVMQNEKKKYKKRKILNWNGKRFATFSCLNVYVIVQFVWWNIKQTQA